ncbi:sulfotransferase family 2 domain-containing protein [Roseibium aggregatum]|uniref:Sulfotransferase family 2 domain-containing protein n=1 Tax=Roseibium aggregatum TaxID=187304 RepID=A0A939EK40_9HYPH|nr:sulfotransferase family 2 domain-containing protein [Roseibium aggregatum]MBN9673149.1 sulfotransferase family 2 domain-containing protein [Roseibium aggregatum]
MAVELKNHNIVYFPMPKVACTSLKMLFFQINEGRIFEIYKEDGKLMHIHNAAYGSPSFWDVKHKDYENMIRIALIRDPVARLLSAYSNRVRYHRELSEQRIDLDLAKKLGVGPNPSPDEFFNNLEKYRILSSSIKHHTDPATTFLGPDLTYFQKIYRIEELDKLTRFLSDTVQQDLVLGREQTGGQKVKFMELERQARKNLTQYCLGDYALMKDYYQIPSEISGRFPSAAAVETVQA